MLTRRDETERRAPILSLQIMRGLAAVAVAAFHTSLIMAKPEYGSVHVLEWLTRPGWMGVNFFFVLSGFIILYAHAGDVGRRERLSSYAWRRFTRLYPTYWVVLSAFVAAALFGFGPINFSLAPGDMLSAYTLLRWTDDPQVPIKVAWTLMFEVLFYVIFGLAILNRWLGLAVTVAWLVAILVASGLGSLEMGLVSMWNINFFFGAGAWLLYSRLPDRWGVWLLAAGVIGLAALIGFGRDYESIETQQATPFSLMLLALPFCLIVAGAALAERRHGFSPPKGWLLLGDASYAIYLVHSAAISALCIVLTRLKLGELLPIATFWVIFTAAISSGVVAHLVMERPLLGAVRRWGAAAAAMRARWLVGPAPPHR